MASKLFYIPRISYGRFFSPEQRKKLESYNIFPDTFYMLRNNKIFELYVDLTLKQLRNRQTKIIHSYNELITIFGHSGAFGTKKISFDSTLVASVRNYLGSGYNGEFPNYIDDGKKFYYIILERGIKDHDGRIFIYITRGNYTFENDDSFEEDIDIKVMFWSYHYSLRNELSIEDKRKIWKMFFDLGNLKDDELYEKLSIYIEKYLKRQ